MLPVHVKGLIASVYRLGSAALVSRIHSVLPHLDMPGSKGSVQSSAEAVQGAVEEATQDGTAQEDSSAAAVQAVLSGAVAKVVYKSAIAAVPDSLSFRQGFLELLGQFRLEGVGAIRQAVLDSIKRDFGDKEECWEVQARAAAAAAGLTAEEALKEVIGCAASWFID